VVLFCCHLLSVAISDAAMKSNRIGLSEYTARRLAELKARRAEADDTGSFSASSLPAAAAEASVNDSDVAGPLPAAAVQNPPTAVANSSSGTDSHSAATVPLAPQPLSKNDPPHSLPSSYTTTASHSVSPAAAAVSNGISEGPPDAADTTSRHKQLNEKPESNQSIKPESKQPNELRRIDKQDFTNAHVVTEPSKPLVQHREIPRPSPFVRSAPHSSNPTTVSGSAVEVGMLSKMASFYQVSQYRLAVSFGIFYFAV